jgi:hypothetical protein
MHGTKRLVDRLEFDRQPRWRQGLHELLLI